MKKLFNLLLVSIAILSFASCNDDDDNKGTSSSVVTFTLNDIDGLDIVYANGSVTYKNATTGIEKTEKVLIENQQFTLTLPQGLYTFSFEGEGSYLLDGTTVHSTFKAQVSSATVTGTACSVVFEPFIYNEKADFVIEEIFYAGTVYPNTGKAYVGDQYFKITNNSDKTLYADGLTLVETKFNSSTKYDYSPNIVNNAITADAIYSIPGNGTQWAIEPGKSLVICDKAMNHKSEAHENSFDLSKADFEWYDESTKPTITDTDNPDVPNLDKIYCYTLTIWTPNKNGNTAFALVRLKNGKDDFLSNNKYDYSYIIINPNTGAEISMKGSTYKVPNDWVIDAVQLATPDKWQWNVVDASLDAGYTYCGSTYNDKNKYGKSVRRKVLSVTGDGRKILQDTNNSSNDFERDATPSLAN